MLDHFHECEVSMEDLREWGRSGVKRKKTKTKTNQEKDKKQYKTKTIFLFTMNLVAWDYLPVFV